MGGNKKNKIQINELFMAQADINRRFYGTIRSSKDDTGNPCVSGKIRINQGYIYSKSDKQITLGLKLDEMVILILDNGLHEQHERTQTICDIDFFLN